jgi:hypothetical protein
MGSLDYSYFRNATAVEVITFDPGSRISEVLSTTFADCTSRQSTCFPASLETLDSDIFVQEHRMFVSQSSVHEITFAPRSHLGFRDRHPFRGCHRLKPIAIPASPRNLRGDSLARCGLETIAFETRNDLFHVSGGFIMNPDESKPESPVHVETIGEFGLAQGVQRCSEPRVCGDSVFLSLNCFMKCTALT